MPFSLTNTPAIFQVYINKSLAGIINKFYIVYLDDILIFLYTKEEYLSYIKRVLDRLRQFRLFISLKKYEFFINKIEFLGFIISLTGITIDKSRVNTIISWLKPKSFYDIQVFLGFINFFRRFIYYYFQKTGLLSALLKSSIKGKKFGPFKQLPDAEDTFRGLRKAFLTIPILRYFDPKLRIRVKTDTSNFSLAGILSQLYLNG